MMPFEALMSDIALLDNPNENLKSFKDEDFAFLGRMLQLKNDLKEKYENIKK